MTVYDKRTRVYRDGRSVVSTAEVPLGLLCDACNEPIAAVSFCSHTKDGKHVWVEKEGVDFTKGEDDEY